MPGSSETAEELIFKFRCIIMLLTLITAINRGGHPTMPRDSSTKPRFLSNPALNALLALFVRNHLIIAAIAHVIPGTLKVVAIQSADSDATLEFQDVSKITAVANPRDEDTTAPSYPSIVPQGQSHLQDFLGGNYAFLFNNRGYDPFQNYVATIQEYLKRSKELAIAKDAEGRTVFQFQFSCFLVASCWEKMRRRISHWSSQSIAFQFGQVTEQQLRAQLPSCSEKMSSTSRRDFALREMLLGMADAGEISELIFKPSGRPDLMSNLPNLLAAMRADSDTEPNSKLGVYNEQTCFEFHQLVTATLLAYGKSLDELHKANVPIQKRWKKTTPGNLKDPQIQDFMQLVFKVWSVAQLLWRIEKSKALRHHLDVLHAGGWIHVPTNTEHGLKQYQNYTGFKSMGCVDPALSHVNADASGDTEGGALGDDIEWFALQRGDTEETVVRNVFRGWFDLQVNYLIELDALTAMCGVAESLPDLEVSLLRMKHLATHGILLEPWRDTVTRLLEPDELKSGRVIALFQKAIDAANDRRSSSNPIFFPFFEPLYKFRGNIHCEAALVSLTQFPENIIDDQVKELMRSDFDLRCIAVSKPCCPVCWELMDVLSKRPGENPENFKVRLHHDTIFPVDLPPWLGYEEMKEMVTRFTRKLLEQIDIMLLNDEVLRSRKISGQSYSSSSSVPTAVDNVAETNFVRGGVGAFLRKLSATKLFGK